MSPNPDFGYDTYKGYGRLKGKVERLAIFSCMWHLQLTIIVSLSCVVRTCLCMDYWSFC